ncbi:MAG TPA: sigma-E factor negative regulatory protein [Ramlibacter sp.]|nr:sigma-E factor negative regulatory protein [Ramlibacter sp.]
MDSMQTQELISALADGQLHGEEFAQGVEAAAANAQARETWHTYHLIGDVLRSGDQLAGTSPAAFMSRLQQSLMAEERPAAAASDTVPVIAAPRPAANDGSFRWKMVAGFASVAALAAVGWTVVGSMGARQDQPQLAAAPAGTVLAGSDRGVMIRDARLDEFLAAHRQLGGASALQAPAGFLRNATFEGPTR